ncbi:uncharacterized protein OCT59_018605 [Rhizophagus irregularis]|uniref:uncharacterized protein n=1 Tax=Rhizophagus irregularis TaxID=588596 RepID=UPI00331AAC7F|nr:hypothetical protein OCT59_018605 [Rhizophagus irregularis]
MQRMEAAAKAVETLNIKQHIVPQWNECEMKLLERVRLLDSVTTISSSRQPDLFKHYIRILDEFVEKYKNQDPKLATATAVTSLRQVEE